jgi:hypothetical protein
LLPRVVERTRLLQRVQADLDDQRRKLDACPGCARARTNAERMLAAMPHSRAGMSNCEPLRYLPPVKTKRRDTLR